MDLATAATDWRPAAVFLQAGASERGSAVAGVGARWPLDRHGQDRRLAMAVEAGVVTWSARQDSGGREKTLQLTVTPLFRWRGGSGASPWFLEAGIGVSYHTRHYVAKSARQASRWNFNDVLGVGWSVGAHEVGLRLTHFSCAGLAKPNPGDTSVSLHWSVRY